MGGDLLLAVNSQRHLLIPGWLQPVKGPVLAGLWVQLMSALSS